MAMPEPNFWLKGGKFLCSAGFGAADVLFMSVLLSVLACAGREGIARGIFERASG